MRHFTKRMLPLRGHGVKAVSAMAIFLAASGTTVSAQTYYTVDTANNTTLDNIETGVYAIRIKSDKANTDANGRWLYATSTTVTSGSNVAETATLSPYTKSTDGYLWQVTKTTTTTDGTTTSTYTFQSLSTSKYWGCANNTATSSNQWTYTTTTSPTQWTLTQCTASGYTDYIYPYTGNHLVCHNSGGTLGTWPISTTSANLASLKFYKATEKTSGLATLNFKDSDNKTLLTKRVVVAAGTDMTTLPDSLMPLYNHYYTISSCTSETKTVSDTDTVFDYTVTEANTPFTLSSDASKTYYTIRVRNATSSGANNYLIRTGDGNQAINSKNSTYTTSSITTKANFDNGLWAFVKDGLGVKLLSKGSGKYVTVTSDSYSSNKIEVNLTATGTTFYTATGSSASDFALTYNGTGALGDHKNEKLCVWNGDGNFSNSKSDDGSGFKITAANTTDVLAIAKNIGNTLVTNATKGSDTDGYLLGISESKATTLKAAYDTITSVASFDALYGDGTLSVDPDADTYYRIETKGDYTYKYITSAAVLADKEGTVSSASDDDRAILRANSAAALTPQLWKFEKSGDGYNLVNANTGLKAGQLQSATQAGLRMPAASTQESAHLGVFTAKTTGTAGVFNITESGHLLNAYRGTNDTALGAWDQSGTSGEGNQWKIKAITEVPVTVGSTGWASLCLPFAVTLPSDTEAKAYIGTAAAGANLKLKEISGTIPAKTGFLLALSGGGDVTLTISSDNSASLSESNVLAGATAKRTGFDGGANYFLALDPNYNRAVFMQAADNFTVVPANKAYIPAANVQTTSGESSGKLNFTFDGGDTTGISAAQSENQRAVKYYDLSGRRVLFPANGIFVTDKGEKVFVR